MDDLRVQKKSMGLNLSNKATIRGGTDLNLGKYDNGSVLNNAGLSENPGRK
jgi:hypothetical protein